MLKSCTIILTDDRTLIITIIPLIVTVTILSTFVSAHVWLAFQTNPWSVIYIFSFFIFLAAIDLQGN